ncbi:DUF4349 domain-containing protein [Nodularia spumigena]|uniref:DUF4349 domain-containing protein n=1 Tax=Nodularia spumigena TaxID=70799 RepID=UPI000940D068|nr:DUF4349 domain-containing protein [Nodularia spumigena]
MRVSTKLPQKSAVLVSALLGGVIFSSCASSVQPSLNPGLSSGDRPQNIAAAQPTISESMPQAEAAPVPRALPQLIKKAAMFVIVNSVSQSIDAVSQIINQQQGDIIGLNERQPTRETNRHTASMTLRVPQNLLEPTIKELAKLGTVSNRNITAEDVGDRLVDFQARLNNLQRTEANLQKIMDRAGSIRDVLSVAQELNNVRQSIEQIDAQLKSLKNQVAYSTITLNFVTQLIRIHQSGFLPFLINLIAYVLVVNHHGIEAVLLAKNISLVLHAFLPYLFFATLFAF